MAKAQRGGARPNSGPAKGTKYAPTLEKEALRQVVREKVAAHLTPLLEAQVDNATGIRHFMVRGAGGKFERLTDPAQIEAALNADGAEEGSTYWIYTKDPSVQAFTDLLNRLIDKPKEQEQEIKLTGDVDMIAALYAGRQRAADKRKA